MRIIITNTIVAGPYTTLAGSNTTLAGSYTEPAGSYQLFPSRAA